MTTAAPQSSKRVQRSDVGELRNVESTPQGGIRVDAYVTRVGVLKYPQPDGTISRELRPPEEVFAADSLATFANAPVTDLHPEENGQPVEVSALNWRSHAVGHVEPGAVQEGDFVKARLVIQDAEEIAQIKSGARREVSCGYTCELDPTPGDWLGEKYDAIHRKIRNNHVATGPVGWGRAGREVSLRVNSKPKEGGMKTIRVDGIDYEFGSDSHIQAQQKWDAAREARINQLTKTAEESRAALATEQAARKKDADEIPAKIQRRADMLSMHEAAHRLRGKKRDAEKAALAEPATLLEEIVKLTLGVDIAGKTAEEALGMIVKHSLGKQQAASNEMAPPPAEAGPDEEDPNMVDAEGLPPVAIAAGGVTLEQLAHARMIERNRNAASTRKGT